MVTAMMDSLIADKKLQPATHVMVIGDSAGGVAAPNNADFMLQRVRAQLRRSVRPGHKVLPASIGYVGR